jgi:tetratricopeptide (TPR) repeat protein
MKQDAGERVSRLRDRPLDGTAPEDRAAALIRGLGACDEPSELQLARIEQGIGARASHRSRPSLALRVALAMLFLLVGAATVKAYELARRAGWFDRIQGAGPPPSEPARSLPSRRPVRTAATASSLPSSTLDQSAVAKEPILAIHHAEEPETIANDPPRRQAPASRRVANLDPPPYAQAPTTGKYDPFEPVPTVPEVGRTAEKLTVSVPLAAPSQEIHALDRAIAMLRRDRDAAAALAALDVYLDRYPHGVLQREARLARVDALLLLQGTDEALAALETLPLDSGRRSTELQVVRAELRARMDCARADEDFSMALTHSPDAALLERILYGRGACRAKLGRASDAAEDLRRYLDRFPNGAHATWARQWLDRIDKSPVKGG